MKMDAVICIHITRSYSVYIIPHKGGISSFNDGRILRLSNKHHLGKTCVDGESPLRTT